MSQECTDKDQLKILLRESLSTLILCIYQMQDCHSRITWNDELGFDELDEDDEEIERVLNSMDLRSRALFDLISKKYGPVIARWADDLDSEDKI